MKLLAEIYSLIEPSEMDMGASVMTYPNAFTTKISGKTRKARKQTVVIKSSGDGTIYGRKTIHQ